MPNSARDPYNINGLVTLPEWRMEKVLKDVLYRVLISGSRPPRTPCMLCLKNVCMRGLKAGDINVTTCETTTADHNIRIETDIQKWWAKEPEGGTRRRTSGRKRGESDDNRLKQHLDHKILLLPAANVIRPAVDLSGFIATADAATLQLTDHPGSIPYQFLWRQTESHISDNIFKARW